MMAFSSLKLTTAQKPTQMSAVQQRRNKLEKRLWEQMELAKAQQAGTHYIATKFRTITDNETGLRKQIETNKRVKAWWFVAENGKLSLCVRYGTKVLELAKGKHAVEVGTEKDLLGVLDVIKTAVLAGELDAQIEAAANRLRDGFKG
jgi:hypothetical protein